MNLFYFHNVHAGTLGFNPQSGLFYVAVPLLEFPFVEFVCEADRPSKVAEQFQTLVESRGFGQPGETSIDGYDSDAGFVIGGVINDRKETY